MNELIKQREFLQLLNPVNDDLSRFVLALTRNREDTKDIVSETLLRAYENFGKLNSPQAFKSYLFTIANRIYKRKRFRSRLFGIFDEEVVLNIPDNGVAPDRLSDVDMLYSAIAKLPEAQQTAIILFEISGFSLEEIREIQGGSLSGVKSRLKRGREKLAELLGAKSKISKKEIEVTSAGNNKIFSNGTVFKIKNNDNILLSVSNEK